MVGVLPLALGGPSPSALPGARGTPRPGKAGRPSQSGSAPRPWADGDGTHGPARLHGSCACHRHPGGRLPWGRPSRADWARHASRRGGGRGGHRRRIPCHALRVPRLLGYADADPEAVRYFIPLAIAVFPIALCVAPQALEKAIRGFPRARARGCASRSAWLPLSSSAERPPRDSGTPGISAPSCPSRSPTSPRLRRR
jgi:hypothetical protein